MIRSVRVFVAVLAAVAGVTVSACSSGSSGGAVAISPAAQAEANNIFSTRCATCHGAQGAGDGPGSAGLNPKPRNFREAAWQGSVTDQHINTIIISGGPAVGKSAAMPPNPDLQSKPEVVAALVAHVRSLRQ